ncbi:hypothetical protein GQ600_12903 [Phytophthora cactorum]|nr:hypothetical protein GQ600_12903 [Phytophthora cactorum]
MLPVGPPAGSMERMETTQVSMLLWALRSTVGLGERCCVLRFEFCPHFTFTAPTRHSDLHSRVICASEVTLRRLGWRIPGLDHVGATHRRGSCSFKSMTTTLETRRFRSVMLITRSTSKKRGHSSFKILELRKENPDASVASTSARFGSDARISRIGTVPWLFLSIMGQSDKARYSLRAGDRRRRYCGRFVITTTVKRVANRCYGLLPLAEIAMPLVIGLVGSAGGYRIHVVVDPIALFRFVERPSKREFRFPDKRLLHGRAVEESTKYLEPVIPLRRHRGSELLTAWRTFSVHANNVERVVLVCKHNTENLVPLLQFTVDRILARIEAQAVVTLEKAVVRFPALEYEALTLL